MRKRNNQKSKQLGFMIRQVREQNNFTQDYMAVVLNVSQNAYFKIENGKTLITVDRLCEIATILQVPDWIFLKQMNNNLKLDLNQS